MPVITELGQSYIRPSGDETVAGEMEEITVTDRFPMFPSPPRKSCITIQHFSWHLLSEIQSTDTLYIYFKNSAL